MRTYIYILICIISPITSIYSQNIKKLSTAIYKKQVEVFGECDNGHFNDEKKLGRIDRNKSKWEIYLDFSVQSDTIFFLQSMDIQGSSNLTIWNRKDTLCYYISSSLNSYKPIQNKFSLNQLSIFSLVTDWNIDEIIKQEKKSDSYTLLPRLTNYVTRVIFKNKKYSIDCFRFKDFIISPELHD